MDLDIQYLGSSLRT